MRLFFLWVLAAALGGAACATTGATTSGVPRPRPFPGAAIPGAPKASAPSGPKEPAVVAGPPAGLPIPTGNLELGSIVRTAMAFRGVPYRNGGSDPTGFDCSGFVQYVFARHGVKLPREVRDQVGVGRDVDPEDAREGDLIFFSTEAPGPTHVGMVIDDERFVHAPSSKGAVRVERFDVPYWAQRIVSIKRLLPDD